MSPPYALELARERMAATAAAVQATAQAGVEAARPGDAAAVGRVRDRQRALETLLLGLGRLYWGSVPDGPRSGPAPAPKTALLDVYLDALHIVKWAVDDVYVECLNAERTAVSREEKLPPGPDATTIYLETVEHWLVVSPLLGVGDTNRFNWTFVKSPKDHLSMSGMRFLRTVDFTDTAFELSERIEAAVAADAVDITAAASASVARLGLRPATVHLIGLRLLGGLLALHRQAVADRTDRAGVSSWYEVATHLVGRIRSDALDVLGVLARRELVAGRAAEAAALGLAHTLLVRDLASLYSLRLLDTIVAFSFPSAMHPTGKFASTEVAVGVNGHVEELSTYAGNTNPDDQAGRGVDVDQLIARSATLVGRARTTVVGLLDAARGRLLSEREPKFVRLVFRGDLAHFRRARGVDRRVRAVGTLQTDARGGLEFHATEVNPGGVGYAALAGFPFTFLAEPGRPLALAPSWRRAGAGIEHAWREDQAKRTESLPEVLVGQHELMTDLLEHEAVRAAFERELRQSTRCEIDLRDGRARGRAFNRAFHDLRRTDPDHALERLLRLVGRYLASHTRHTFLNVRDDGQNYVTSTWPTDVTGAELFDCGVYAVRTAHDIAQALQGTGVTVEFRFVTFLNHICVVGTIGDESFLVNNDQVRGPRPVARTAAGADPVMDALRWSQWAYSDVQGVQYAIYLAGVPLFAPVRTNVPEATFRSAIFAAYLRSLGWSLDSATAADYYECIHLFDNQSVQLARLLADAKFLAWDPKAVADAVQLGTDLYAKAAVLGDYKRFVLERRLAGVPYAFKFGYSSPPGTSMPMYELVRRLADPAHRARLTTPAMRALTQQPIGDAHVQAMTDRLDQAHRKMPAGAGGRRRP